MGRWSQTEHKYLSFRVTKAGDTRPPVLLVSVGRFARDRNLAPPLDEACTQLTFHHFVLHTGEKLAGTLTITRDLHITIVSEPQ